MKNDWNKVMKGREEKVEKEIKVDMRKKNGFDVYY